MEQADRTSIRKSLSIVLFVVVISRKSRRTLQPDYPTWTRSRLKSCSVIPSIVCYRLSAVITINGLTDYKFSLSVFWYGGQLILSDCYQPDFSQLCSTRCLHCFMLENCAAPPLYDCLGWWSAAQSVRPERQLARQEWGRWEVSVARQLVRRLREKDSGEHWAPECHDFHRVAMVMTLRSPETAAIIFWHMFCRSRHLPLCGGGVQWCILVVQLVNARTLPGTVSLLFSTSEYLSVPWPRWLSGEERQNFLPPADSKWRNVSQSLKIWIFICSPMRWLTCRQAVFQSEWLLMKCRARAAAGHREWDRQMGHSDQLWNLDGVPPKVALCLKKA